MSLFTLISPIRLLYGQSTFVLFYRDSEYDIRCYNSPTVLQWKHRGRGLEMLPWWAFVLASCVIMIVMLLCGDRLHCAMWSCTSTKRKKLNLLTVPAGVYTGGLHLKRNLKVPVGGYFLFAVMEDQWSRTGALLTVLCLWSSAVVWWGILPWRNSSTLWGFSGVSPSGTNSPATLVLPSKLWQWWVSETVQCLKQNTVYCSLSYPSVIGFIELGSVLSYQCRDLLEIYLPAEGDSPKNLMIHLPNCCNGAVISLGISHSFNPSPWYGC